MKIAALVVGIIITLAILAAILISIVLDWREVFANGGEDDGGEDDDNEDDDGEDDDDEDDEPHHSKSIVSAGIQYGIPALSILVMGMLIRLTNNATGMMLFALVVFLYMVYAIVRLNMVTIYLMEIPLPKLLVKGVFLVLTGIGLEGPFMSTICTLKPTTVIILVVGAIAWWCSIFTFTRKPVKAIIAMVLAVAIFAIGVPKAIEDTWKGENIMRQTWEQATKGLKENKENREALSPEGQDSGDTEENEEVYKFDGIIDSNEELVNETDFLDIAQAAGISTWTYVSNGESGEQYVWADGTIYVYKSGEIGEISVLASEVPETVIVAGGNYFYTDSALYLYKNGEQIADHVTKLHKSADGKGVTYRYHGEDYTVY